jgi:ornithine decarboxylase
MNQQNSPANTLTKEKIKSIRRKTPFFVFSKERLKTNLKNYYKLFPENTEICYSMKANAERDVLKILSQEGASFEVASRYELALLKKLNVMPNRIIYGSSVKAGEDIKQFAKYGVKRYAADSEQELFKIAKFAPESLIYIRMLTDGETDSVFHMSEKFGVSSAETLNLLKKAVKLGLHPYGISFNVGSQARNERAWANGIMKVAEIMKYLERDNIKIKMINIGGGFPHKYKNQHKIPTLSEITKHVRQACKALPYQVKIIAEPGRGIVADTYMLVVGITEKIVRPNGHWIHVNAGVYNALLEAMAYQGSIQYNIEPLTSRSKKLDSFIVTGPACDDLDIIDKNVMLPADLKIGDKLVVHDTGAYTFTLSTSFNGFPTPETINL